MLPRLLTHRPVQILVLVLGLYLIFQVSQNIITLWQAKLRVDDTQAQLAALEQQNKALAQQASEVDAPDFVERQARGELGLVKAGETVLIIPPDQIDKLAQSLRERYQQDDTAAPYLANWQQWLKLFTD